jgi:hypothetical protein
MWTIERPGRLEVAPPTNVRSAKHLFRLRMICWICRSGLCPLSGRNGGRIVKNAIASRSDPQGQREVRWEGSVQICLINTLTVARFNDCISKRAEFIETPGFPVRQSAVGFAPGARTRRGPRARADMPRSFKNTWLNSNTSRLQAHDIFASHAAIPWHSRSQPGRQPPGGVVSGYACFSSIRLWRMRRPRRTLSSM